MRPKQLQRRQAGESVARHSPMIIPHILFAAHDVAPREDRIHARRCGCRRRSCRRQRGRGRLVGRVGRGVPAIRCVRAAPGLAAAAPAAAVATACTVAVGGGGRCRCWRRLRGEAGPQHCVHGGQRQAQALGHLGHRVGRGAVQEGAVGEEPAAGAHRAVLSGAVGCTSTGAPSQHSWQRGACPPAATGSPGCRWQLHPVGDTAAGPT